MKTSIDSTRRRRLRAASAVIGLALAASTGAAIAKDTSQGQMAADLGARAMDIHWPAGFEPEQADLLAVALRRQQPAMVEGRRLAGGAAEPAEPPIRHEFLHAALDGEAERRPAPAHVRCERARAVQETNPAHWDTNPAMRARPRCAARPSRRRRQPESHYARKGLIVRVRSQRASGCPSRERRDRRPSALAACPLRSRHNLRKRTEQQQQSDIARQLRASRRRLSSGSAKPGG
jgi:hypothetical protein